MHGGGGCERKGRIKRDAGKWILITRLLYEKSREWDLSKSILCTYLTEMYMRIVRYISNAVSKSAETYSSVFPPFPTELGDFFWTER